MIARKTSRTNKSKPNAEKGRGRLTATKVLELLGNAYPTQPWKPRHDPISEVVLTILSQHTSDVNSERAFEQLMATFCSLEEVAKGDVGLIASSINVGGLARIKAPRIKEALNTIIERRGSLDIDFLKDLPLEMAKTWLRQIPGIGPKTAAVILCFSLNMPAMAVDTHVYRVTKRLGLIGPRVNYEQAHEILEQAVAPEQVFPFHVGLITHGRSVCKALRPLCDQCVLAYGCPSNYLSNDGNA